MICCAFVCDIGNSVNDFEFSLKRKRKESGCKVKGKDVQRPGGHLPEEKES